MATPDPTKLVAAIEARMGEIASLLDDVAEALAYYPERLQFRAEHAANAADASQIIVSEGEWPSVQEIIQLLANWRALKGSV